MLKRHQVLLTDWLAEYIKYISKTYDLSFSEVIRIGLSIHFGQVAADLTKRKFPITNNAMLNVVMGSGKSKVHREELYKMISKVYFEARKAMELRVSQIKKETS